MKILNLYSGIGGNRRFWGDDHEITAIEYKPEIAKIYQDFFPNDKVIVADAHQYLLDHYKEFDFIWSSPPCPTHSRTNTFLNAQGVVRYPDMKLWQEIVFLQKWFKGKWVVENVISYYPPLYPPQLLDRHYLWANFSCGQCVMERDFNVANARSSIRRPSKDNYKALEKYHGIKLKKRNLLLLRNCVNPELGKHILECALGLNKQKQLI